MKGESSWVGLLINIVGTIKNVAKRAVIKDWSRPKPAHFFSLWIVLAVLVVGTLSHWREFPLNGDPIAWSKASSLYEEAMQALDKQDKLTALTKLQQCVKTYPNDVNFLNELARVQSISGQPATAIDTLRKSLLKKADQPNVLITLAQRFGEQGKRDQAMDQLDAALKLEPANNEAIALKSVILLSDNKKEEAEKLFAQTQNLPKDTARFWSFAGKYYKALAKDQEAEAAFRQAASLDRTYGAYQAALAEHLISQRKWDEAKLWLERATRLEPDNADYWTSYALILHKQNQLPESIDALSRAATLQPSNPLILEKLGELHRQNNNLNAAAQSLKRATELAPERARSWDLLIDCLVKLKRFPEAKIAVTRFMNLSPDNERNPVAWSYLGQLLQHDGNIAGAKIAYDKALALSNNANFNSFCKDKIAELLAQGQQKPGVQ